MSNYDFCKQLFEWGCDISGYVGLTITQDEYKNITSNDYAAGANA